MSKPGGRYRAWQEGGPNETKHGGPWFVTVPDGGDIEIGYAANGLPDEYHARLFASADALAKALERIASETTQWDWETTDGPNALVKILLQMRLEARGALALVGTGKE